MPKAQGIEPNMPDLAGAQTTRAQNSVGKFNTVFDAMSYGASIVGPVAYTSTALKSPRGAEIVGAAVNATAGYGSMPGAYSGALSTYGAGGGGLNALSSSGYPAAPGGSGDMITNARDMLAQSQASSVALLMVQDEMGLQNRTYTSVSNLMNSRDTMLGSIIRNVRVG